MSASLHPAENRALRELYATSRQLHDHWLRLSGALSIPALAEGASSAAALAEELASITPRYGLYGFPAATRVGSSLAGARTAVGDRFLERNQALRLAVLDVEHVVTLLGYLARLARSRRDAELEAFHERWEAELTRRARSVRRLATAAGDSPDEAIEPLDSSLLGRAGQRTAYLVGSVGEWIDRRRGRHAGTGRG